MRIINFSNVVQQSLFNKAENNSTETMHFKNVTNQNYDCRQKLSFNGYKPILMPLNEMKLMEAFKKDNEYRAQLAKCIGCDNISALKSVVGKNELAFLLKNQFKPHNFFPGENNENVKNGIFCVNMHNHTIFSDGLMTPKKLLDKALAHSQNIRKTVYISLTDHNEVEGNKKAIEVLSKNPDKYKNVRFIPGMEIFLTHMPENAAPEIKSTHLEMLIYCLNPNDADIKKLLNGKSYKETSGSPAFMSIPIESVQSCFENKSVLRILAHPGRTKLSPATDMQQFLNDFIKTGGDGVEAYYTYPTGKYGQRGSQHTEAEIYADENSLFKTGGRDAHGYNIFNKNDKE